MEVFGIIRGSVKRLGSGKTLGDIQPTIISFATGAGSMTMDTDSILVSGFSIEDREKLGIVQCFNDWNHLYAFGHDPENSMFAVTFAVFLGKKCMTSQFEDGGNLKSVIAGYNKYKASTEKKTIYVTFGDGSTAVGLITDLRVDVADAELNALTVTMSGKLLRWR